MNGKQTKLGLSISAFTCLSLVMIVGWRTGLLLPQVAVGQISRPRPIIALPSDIYLRTLDALLGDIASKKHDYAIRLRLIPSFHPERQLSISRDLNNQYVLKCAEAKVQIHQLADVQYAQTGQLDLNALKKNALVRSKNVRIASEPSYVKRGGFLAAISESMSVLSQSFQIQDPLTHVVQLDGTNYQVTYFDGMYSMSFELQGSEVETPPTDSDLPLVAWIRRAYDSACSSSNQPTLR